MSSFANPRQPGPHNSERPARLIPGVAVAMRSAARKRPQPVSPTLGIATEPHVRAAEDSAEEAASLFVPSPLRSRSATSWLRALILDFSLIGLNWLLIGAIISPLHAVFPRVHPLEPAPGTSFPSHLLGIALLYAALVTLFGYTEGLYSTTRDRHLRVRALAKAILWSTALLCIAHRLQGASLSSMLALCAGGALHFISLLAWRWEDERSGYLQQQHDPRNVLILGAGDVGRGLASQVESHPEGGRVVSGFLDDTLPLGNGVIGKVCDLARLARTGFVDEVILAMPHDRELTLRVLNEARQLHLDVELAPDLFGCEPEQNELDRVGDLPVICLHEERLPAEALLLKRFCDVLGAGSALILLAPLLALLAILIKCGSSGPAIYAAPRAGRKGRPFQCFKFRTMVSNADELKHALRNRNERSGPFFKIANDPRITRVGRFLRRYSLDELPQLWNVLRGEMSLVGPRPHPLDDFAAYEVEHLDRLDVTPGLTGLWQVTARRDSSFQKGIELDREYIRRWSLRMDLRILLQTLRAVVQGSGD